ncbi:craniofacial development protein 2-like [Teleopsis dalmanni]|uniref:craniofacial development protein 2-like n=1 Tax=Teleopsis dalmanni TaxID=139649 RepID=UPI0018CF6613|nr:craniofacial development protein 2-like [Teleopsis dalmanni]
MATLAAECDRFKIDVIGISEVRWNGTGEFTNQKGGVLMYSGMPDEQDPHIRGVAVYVKKNVKHSILCWKAISERIIVVRFRAKKFNMSLVQCYAPTEDSPLDQKEVFYSALERTLSEIPRTDVIILMGDFNAQIGGNNSEYRSVMGSHGIGTCNENGELFLELCMNYDLRIGGSLFPHKTCHKVTWKSPAGNFESQIDHICISKRWSKALCDVRNKRSADIDSDHYLVVAELKFNIPKHRYEHPQHTRRTYNTTKLNVGAVKNEMIERINNVS